MKMIPSALVVLVVLGIGVYVFMSAPWQRLTPPLSTYSSSVYGISMGYPDQYALEEREVGNGERYHYVITLIEKTALENIPEGGEGPPAINVDIYQNNLDNVPVEDWIRGRNDSNFKLSVDGRVSSTSVGGVQAYYYRWDGLYQGESTALAHKGNIIVFTVTYLAPEDQIRTDFSKILSSVALY